LQIAAAFGVQSAFYRKEMNAVSLIFVMRRIILHLGKPRHLCYHLTQIGKERLDFMFWKMTNLQLKKGNILLLCGDSAPFFRKICRRTGIYKQDF
jgi:hypothetical protein